MSQSLKLINLMHLIPLLPDMIEVWPCFQLQCWVYEHLATKWTFIFHLYTCVLPLKDQQSSQNNQTQVVIFRALVFGTSQHLKIVHIWSYKSLPFYLIIFFQTHFTTWTHWRWIKITTFFNGGFYFWKFTIYCVCTLTINEMCVSNANTVTCYDKPTES